MTDKRVKNEQWYVKELINKVNNKDIFKPKFQRKRKWTIRPEKTGAKKSIPSEKTYIEFLFKTINSVDAISFGQSSKDGKIIYSNIDGNNRINAITHFMNKPFEIFNDYLNDLIEFIDELDLDQEIKIKLIEIFKNLSYNTIINFKYNKYFIEIGLKDLYQNKLKIYRDEFEVEIEKIQKMLKIKGEENFDTNVKINANIFEGYTHDELCNIFEDINKYTSKLTEKELLACSLCNITNFVINNKSIKIEIEREITKYYKKISDNESLDCYNYIEGEDLNAYDFIIGLQNYCNEKYKFIESSDDNKLSTFFKLYKELYGFTSFTTDNVNDFIVTIIYVCEILKEIQSIIFTNLIDDKLFNTKCKKKIITFSKNHLYMILSCIIGFYRKKTERSLIIKEIEKCILYNLICSDIKSKDYKEGTALTIKDYFKSFDTLQCKAACYSNTIAKKLYKNPETINDKLSKDKFNELLNQYYIENNTPHERYLPDKKKYKCDKRRKRRFTDKILMFYFYKENVPVNMLKEKFNLEHIFPNSSEWKGNLDKDRLGNLFPIIATLNFQRQNKHIKTYRTSKHSAFCKFVNDFIPSDLEYDEVIKTDGKKVIITDNDKYNFICKRNEEIYKNNFIECIYK